MTQKALDQHVGQGTSIFSLHALSSTTYITSKSEIAKNIEQILCIFIYFLSLRFLCRKPLYKMEASVCGILIFIIVKCISSLANPPLHKNVYARASKNNSPSVKIEF